MTNQSRLLASLLVLPCAVPVLAGTSALSPSQGRLIWCPENSKATACKEVITVPQSPVAVSITASEPIAVREAGGQPLAVSLAASEPIPVWEPKKESFLGPEWMLVWVTGALAIVTGGLFYWTMRLARGAAVEAEANAKISNEALQAARLSADASAQAVGVMQSQLEAARTSATANAGALDVMQKQFALANAPRLALRLATVRGRSHQQAACVVAVQMHIENTGLSKAVVRNAGFYLDWQPEAHARVPAQAKVGGEPQLPAGTIIEPGEILVVDFSVHDFLWPADGLYKKSGSGTPMFLHLLGRVVYADESGNLPGRTLAFYRRYKGDEERYLKPIGDAGLEYNV